MKVWSLFSLAAATGYALARSQERVAADLKNLVAAPSQVDVKVRARWSDYNAPLPHVVVSIRAERDIALVVSQTPIQ